MKNMGYHMESNTNKISAFFGIVGGLVRYFLNINLPVDFWQKLGESAITALICGACGLLGKEIIGYGVKSFKAYFRKRKK